MTEQTKTGLGIEDIIGNKRDDILRLAAQYGAFNVRVFGSVARGEAREDSDVDFLVDFKSGYRLMEHVGFVVDLQELLGRRVEVAIEKNLREELRPYIMKDITPL